MEKEKLSNPIISIIVPVYNVEKYLNRCIESILNQTFPDFELILIDDGSTDKSGDICDDYKSKDSRVKVIHKNNEGVSVARNVGLDNSKGTYILFVDSDDYIDNDLLEIAVCNMQSKETDIIFWGFYNEYINGEIYKRKFYNESIITSDIKNICIELYKRDLFGYTWCKMFRRTIIKDNKIYFDRDMKYCEDEEFTANYCKYINSLAVINQYKYHYINYGDSRITLTNFGQRDELFNRNKLFIRWSNLLERDHEVYLVNKAYKNLRFIFFNIVWADYDRQTKKNKINNIKDTYIYNYLKLNSKELKHKILYSFIELNNVVLFKVVNRIAMLLKFEI